MSEKVYIGKLKKSGELIFLDKHSWDCGWYWGFGYLGNKNIHFHFDSMVPNESNKNEIVFDLFDQKIMLELREDLNGWLLMELFQQAYILKNYAELLYCGSSGITGTDCGVQQDRERAKEINDQLKKILDAIWNYVNRNKK